MWVCRSRNELGPDRGLPIEMNCRVQVFGMRRFGTDPTPKAEKTDISRRHLKAIRNLSVALLPMQSRSNLRHLALHFEDIANRETRIGNGSVVVFAEQWGKCRGHLVFRYR